MSYISGIIIVMVNWYATRLWLRVCGSNPHGDLTKRRLKLLLLTLKTLILLYSSQQKLSSYNKIVNNSIGLVFN